MTFVYKTQEEELFERPTNKDIINFIISLFIIINLIIFGFYAFHNIFIKN